MCYLYEGLLVDIGIPVMPKTKEKVASESMIVKWG